jgi:ribosomal protein S18 acetylase RimI-like enzyme
VVAYGSTLQLRLTSPADECFLRAVYSSARAEEIAQVPWTEAQKQSFLDQQFAAQDSHYRQHYPTAQFYVIEQAGVRVGRLYVDHWTREIRVMDITLLPRFRGTGIGTHLLKQVQEEARAAHKAVSIHVEKFNPALRLYERLGFQTKEDKGVYLLMEWTG